MLVSILPELATSSARATPPRIPGICDGGRDRPFRAAWGTPGPQVHHLVGRRILPTRHAHRRSLIPAFGRRPSVGGLRYQEWAVTSSDRPGTTPMFSCAASIV